MDTKSLMTMDEKTMLERVDMGRFPQDLAIADKKVLAQVAITYGFDPLMGEVTIYQGRPFVSIDGRYRKAQETKKLDGVETRPATKQEKTDWQIPEGDYFFRAEVYVKGASRAFVGWGRVRKAETIGGKGFKPVETNPQRMAEKRAEAQALRKAFHIPLPSFEDIGTEESEPDYDIESTARSIDENTGEITEEPTTLEPPPEVSESTGEPSKAEASVIPSEEAKQAEPESATETQGFVDMSWLNISLKTLRDKKFQAWSESNLLSYMKTTYSVEALTVLEAVAKLSKGQATHFVKRIQETLEIA